MLSTIIDTIGRLSALIAEALPQTSSGRGRYIEAAINSATFIHTHLFNVRNVVLDGINVQDGESRCSTGAVTFPYNAGLFVEGLAVLVSMNVTSEDADLKDL